MQRRKSRSRKGKGIPWRKVKETIPDYLKKFVRRKFSQIDASSLPFSLKEELKHMLWRMARSYQDALTIAQPKVALPHSLIVALHSNTLFKEFQRFLQSRNIKEFISKRYHLGEMDYYAKRWYGTKKEMIAEIQKMLEANKKIPEERKKEVLDFLQKNNKILTTVQVHRIKHYVVGLAIEARLGFKRKAK